MAPGGAGEEPPVFHVAMEGCPIVASLGVLGKKWALVLLRDAAFFGRTRFSDYLKANEALTPRVLSRRLKELVSDGLFDRVEGAQGEVSYRLTEKGRDAIPILSAFFQYGAKHHPKGVFVDGRSHGLGEVFPGQQEFILGDLAGYARERRRPSAR